LMTPPLTRRLCLHQPDADFTLLLPP